MFKILNISFICFMENGEESGCIRKGSRDSWTLGDSWVGVGLYENGRNRVKFRELFRRPNQLRCADPHY